jgi:DNA repair protein RadA/Sms
MTKLKTIYVCQRCAYTASQWVGQCPQCGEWNSFVEDVTQVSQKTKSGLVRSSGGKNIGSIKPIKLSDISSKPPKRLSSGVSEFDRVLGGGFVPGQVVLLSGEPGIGKSTILTEICKNLKENEVLYVCGEENIDQIKLRVSRMGYNAKNLTMFAETNLEAIDEVIRNSKDIKLIIIDSVQTLYSEDLTGIAGSITQVRGCTQVLTNTVKSLGIPMVLVGHVTKEGVVAGPKVLEHIVDTVLYLEGDSQHLYRILRTTKNRFGPVSEVGIFEMGESGMEEVPNPSKLFLEQRLEKSPGSCVTVVMEGYRPILFEIQALTIKTSFGYPKRTASGFNVNRLQVLLATLEKRLGLNLGTYDVYLNVAGGFKVNEYAVDLAVCLAIVSSINNKPLKEKTLAFGECGLNGEVRRVAHQDKRVKEARKLGYLNIISPERVRSISSALKTAF